MRERRQPEIIAGTVGAAAAILTASDDFSVTLSGTSTYTITLPSNFRLISVTAFCLGGGTTTVNGGNVIPTGNVFVVGVFNPTTGASVASSFCFIAAGVQT